MALFVVFLACACLFGLARPANAQESMCPFILPPSDYVPAITYEPYSPVTAQVSAALESAIAVLVDESLVAEYAVSVVHDGKTVFTSGKSTTPFLIGSITKTFTALGALILRAKGLLSLDDPVKKFLPDFSIINPYQPHDITLRELMGHASGLPRDYCLSDSCSQHESKVLELVAKMELVRPPWSREPCYSNLGFALLGHAWEKATSPSKSWGEFVMDDIVNPLGLKDTGVDATNVTLAYTAPGSRNIGWIAPAGQMYSTATDLAKFLIFLLSASPPLISDAIIREWTRSSTLFPDSTSGFALPWELFHINSTKDFIITKDGSSLTFTSFIAFHPPTQLGVSVLFAGNDSTLPTPGPPDVGLEILNILIPVVEEANSKIIDRHYSGIYICESTPQIVSPNLNVTVKVLGGHVNISGSPSVGLTGLVDLSLLVDGQVTPLSGRTGWLLKNATENSFWVDFSPTCFSVVSSVGSYPSLKSPNFPGSVYLYEMVFDLPTSTLVWPSFGARCVK